MKPKTIQSILAAALLAPGALFAQTTATTTPVGYYVQEAIAGGNLIVPGLVKADAFAGVITGSGATTLSLAANSLTAGAYDDGPVYPTHYVEIVTAGSNQGVVIDIVSNTASQITLATDISGLSLVGNERIVIRKHNTIASVFADTESTVTLFTDAVTIPNPDGSSDTYYLIGAGSWSSDFTVADGNDRPIPPGSGFVYDAAADADLTFSGTVKSSPVVVQLAGNSVVNIVGPVNPLVGSSKQISLLGFQNMLAFTDSITTYAPGDLVTPLFTYYADGAGNVTTDFTTPSTDVFPYTYGAVLSAAADTAIRLSSGL
jgi:hypothetical protein